MQPSPGSRLKYVLHNDLTNGSTYFKLLQGFHIFDITLFRLKPFYTDLVDGLDSVLLRLWVCLRTSVRKRYS